MAFVRRADLTCVALCAALLACGESVSPAPPPPTLTIGGAVSIALGATDGATTYRLPVARDSVYAVSITPTTGYARVTVRTDSGSNTAVPPLLSVAASADTVPQIYDIHPAAAGTLFVQVASDRDGQAVSLTLLVDRVPVAPEHVPAVIAPRVFVADERLDDAADIDRFTYTATTSEQFQPLIAAAPGVPAGDAICLVVSDTAGNALGYTDAYAPDTTRHGIASGALVIGAGTYRLEVGSVRNECRISSANDAPYVGPYQIQVFPVDTAPETASPVVALGDTVRGEAVDYPGDVDVFALSGPPGTTINLLLSSLGGTSASSTQIDVLDETGTLLAHAVSDPTNPGLLPASTGDAVIPASGVVTLRVSGLRVGTVPSEGPYEFVANAVNLAPEQVPALVTVGDTVSGEAIDFVGDIDDFTFQGDTGTIYSVVVQATGSGNDHVDLTLGRADTAMTFGVASSTDGDTGLMPPGTAGQVSQRFTLPAPGPYRIRVRGANDRVLTDVGPYRFLVYRIDPGPETASASFALGDTVSGEAIDVPNDVDTFAIAVPNATGAMIIVDQRAYGLLAPITLAGATDTFAVPTTNSLPVRYSLAPGVYALRLTGSHSPYRPLVGTYTVYSWAFSWGPEHVGDTITVGDTVRGEWPDNPVDVDRFHVYGGTREHLNVLLARGPLSHALVANLRLPGDTVGVLRGLYAGSDTLGIDQTRRIDLPDSGWYTLDIMRAGSSLAPDPVSPYTVLIEPANTTPEHVPAAIALGDTISTETIDFLGDYDEFQLTAPPGQAVDAKLEVGDIQYGSLALQAYDSTTASVIASVSVPTRTSGTTRFTVPPSGRVTLSVAEPFRASYSYTAIGPYRLSVLPAQ